MSTVLFGLCRAPARILGLSSAEPSRRCYRPPPGFGVRHHHHQEVDQDQQMDGHWRIIEHWKLGPLTISKYMFQNIVDKINQYQVSLIESLHKYHLGIVIIKSLFFKCS